MKLYYDMLIPYMPDSVTNENGELVASERKSAGRKAMMELANFQASGNTLSLYQAVIFACTYAEQDLVKVVLDVTDEDSDLDIPAGTAIDAMLDAAAKALFSSIKAVDDFDYKLFVGNVLTAAHVIMATLAANKRAEEADALREPQNSEANPQ